jgi:putative (di)nucleoside polyphosphate hydrolase
MVLPNTLPGPAFPGDDFPEHRPNVGVVLFNAAGLVWQGHREGDPDPNLWQFPQGGVDEGEDLETAALRELAEETGVTSVSLLARTTGWLAYDFPPGYGHGRTRSWRGQKQAWFAFRFEGQDSEVKLDQHHSIEFDAWRWAPLAGAPALVIPFKRAVYEQVAATFAPFAVEVAA